MDRTVHDNSYTSPEVLSYLDQTNLVPRLKPCLRSTPPPTIETEVSELIFFRFPANLIHEFQSYLQSSVLPTQVTVHFITLMIFGQGIYKQIVSSYLIFFLSTKNIIS